MKERLRNDKGAGYITACVITIAIAMILSSVFFYAECITIIQNTRDMTEEVLESFIIENAVLIYDSIKQGHDLTEQLSKNFLGSEISSRFSLDFVGNTLYSHDKEGYIVYAMTDPELAYKVDKSLKLKASYQVAVPVRVAGKRLFFLRIPLTVTRSLTVKA